jgi:hypothetical protein
MSTVFFISQNLNLSKSTFNIFWCIFHQSNRFITENQKLHIVWTLKSHIEFFFPEIVFTYFEFPFWHFCVCVYSFHIIGIILYVLVYFIVAVTKYLRKSTQKEEGFILFTVSEVSVHCGRGTLSDQSSSHHGGQE